MRSKCANPAKETQNRKPRERVIYLVLNGGSREGIIVRGYETYTQAQYLQGFHWNHL